LLPIGCGRPPTLGDNLAKQEVQEINETLQDATCRID
jgi:hypothetical protein